MPEERTESFETSTADLFGMEEDEPKAVESVAQPAVGKPISQEISITELVEEEDAEIATSQILPEEIATSEQPEKHYPENLAEWVEYEEKIDESYNFGDLPAAKEALLKRLAMLLVKRRFTYLFGDAERISVENVRRNLIEVQKTEALDLGEEIEAAACAGSLSFIEIQKILVYALMSGLQLRLRNAWIKRLKRELPVQMMLTRIGKRQRRTACSL